jgi:hypothetical protein
VDREIPELLKEHLRKAAEKPFGDVESISGQVLSPFSRASLQAARNLLAKACRSIEQGEPGRAKAFVDRAVGLPFDEHERAAPAALAAAFGLYDVITDAVEAAEPESSRWLDAALAVLHEDGSAGFDLRDTLAEIEKVYVLSRDERSRIRSAIADIPDRDALYDLDLSPAELSSEVMRVVSTWVRFRKALRG